MTRIFTKEHRQKLSEAHKGKKHSDKTKAKISEAHVGFRHSVETRKRMSEQLKGDKAPNWKGGLTPINKSIRKSVEFKLWREAVFKRDDYRCLDCGIKNLKGLGKTVEIHPDHILPFATYPRLRFDINNGRTLCADCHRKTPTWGRQLINKYANAVQSGE